MSLSAGWGADGKTHMRIGRAGRTRTDPTQTRSSPSPLVGEVLEAKPKGDGGKRTTSASRIAASTTRERNTPLLAPPTMGLRPVRFPMRKERPSAEFSIRLGTSLGSRAKIASGNSGFGSELSPWEVVGAAHMMCRQLTNLGRETGCPIDA